MQCGRCKATMLELTKFWFCDECGNHLVRDSVHTPNVLDEGPRFEVDSLPTVLAIPLAEFNNEHHLIIRLHRMCNFVEVVTRFCTLIAIAEIRSVSERSELPHTLRNRVQESIRRPTFGQWRVMLELMLASPCWPDESDLVFPRVRDFVDCHLTPLIPGGQAADTRCLINLRNHLVHSGTLSSSWCESLLKEWSSRFENFVDSLKVFAEHEVILRRGGRIYPLIGRKPKLPKYNDDVLLRLEDSYEGHVYLRPRFGSDALEQRRSKPSLDFPPDSYTPKLPLDLWPFHLYRPAITSTRVATIDSSWLYQRQEPTHLEFALFGGRMPMARHKKALVDFERMLGRDLNSLPRPSLRHFEEEIRRDADLLIGRGVELRRAKAVLRTSQGTRESKDSVLWIGGSDGVGKTVFISRLARDFGNDPSRVCRIAWRFVPKDPRCNRNAFLRHAIHTLSHWNELPLKKRSWDPNPNKLLTQWKSLLDEVAQLKAANKYLVPPKVFVFLDGLEVISEIDPAFLNFPFEYCRENVVWICAGRQEGQITELFRPELCRHLFSGGLSAVDDNELRSTLLEEAGEGSYAFFLMTEDEQANLVRDISARANGDPRFVQMLGEDLRNGRLDFDQRGLERIPCDWEGYVCELMTRRGDAEAAELRVPLLVLFVESNQPLPIRVIRWLLRNNEFMSEDASDTSIIETALWAFGPLVRSVPIGNGAAGYRLMHSEARGFISESLKATSSALFSATKAVLTRFVLAWDTHDESEERCFALAFGPRLLFEARDWSALATLLTDWSFVQAKCEAGLGFELLDDYSAAEGVEPVPSEPGWQHVRAFGDFFRRHAQTLDGHLGSLLQRAEAEPPASVVAARAKLATIVRNETDA